MVSFGFDYALGWLALLSLLPLIILYLIKPKPKEIAVPSLMFFQREERRKRERAFLRRLRRDWLFLAQLLVLLLLGLFFIQPYMIFSKSLLLDNSVIVLDASASMQAGGAFEQAVEKAREVIGKRTTLIMIARAPYVALKDADRKSVTQFLDELSVGAVSSSVGSAMMLALRHLEGEQPDVFVISDFRDTGSVNVVEARQALENAGAVVHLVNVGEDVGKENIGIVDLELSEDEGRVSIKNFKQRGEIVDIIIDGKQKSISLEPGEMENVAVPVSEGVHEITLAVQDDILVDNRAFAVVPSSGKVNVLLLSDDPSPYLLAALSSSDQIILEVYGTIPDE